MSPSRPRDRRALLVRGALAAVVLWATALPAQEPERYVFSDTDIAFYNLVGELRIEGGTGPNVVIDVVRGGADADRLAVETGRIEGRPAFRVLYPSDRIVYRGRSRASRSTVRVREDGTFGGRRGGSRPVTISGSGSGLEAWADVHVRVPAGARAAFHLAVGRVEVANVDGEIVVDVGAAPIEAAGARGRLRLDTGSGAVVVRDAEGEVEIDTGSGGVTVAGVRGSRLHVDTGAGRVTGEALDVEHLNVDTGSGSIRLGGVRARDVRLETGSGAVDLELLAGVDRLEIDTGLGSVSLIVPPSLDANLEIDTGSGGIDVDGLVLQRIEQRRSYLLARSGQGTGTIRIDTGSGSVRVRGS